MLILHPMCEKNLNQILFNTPGLKIDSTKHPLHIHNNGLTHTIPTNNNSPMATGISEHALNSEHIFTVIHI